MKRVLAFILFTLFVFSFSIYQSCKQVRHCIILNQVIMQLYNSHTGKIMQATDSVPAKNLYINISMDTKEFSCMNTHNISFISQASAYKVQPVYLFYDTLKSITITCLQDFDSTHHAGTSLNEYFSVPESFPVINEFTEIYSYNLQAVPDNEMFYEFRVSAQFTGGTLYDTILPPIKILL